IHLRSGIEHDSGLHCFLKTGYFGRNAVCADLKIRDHIVSVRVCGRRMLVTVSLIRDRDRGARDDRLRSVPDVAGNLSSIELRVQNECRAAGKEYPHYATLHNPSKNWAEYIKVTRRTSRAADL